MSVRSFVAPLALGLVVCAADGAAAQRAVDVELFHPSLDGYGILSVERTQTSPQWRFGFSLWANGALSPLRLALYDAGTLMPRRTVLIDRQIALDFGAHVGLLRWLELALDLPVSSQSYTDAYGHTGSAGDPTVARTGFYAADRYTNVPPPDVSPLDARLALKARLVQKSVFGLGLVATVTLPFGDDSAFLGDGGFTFRPLVVADVTAGRFTVAVNAGAIVRGRQRVVDPHDLAAGVTPPRVLLEVGDELTYAIGAAYRCARLVGLAVAFYGYEPLAVSPGVAVDRTADVVAAVQLFPWQDVAVTVGGGSAVFRAAARRDDARAFVGLSWTPAAARGPVTAGGADRDGDGVPDAQDLCPTEPEDRDGFDDDDGCPDPDNDQDGIPDRSDRCPDQAEDRDGFADEDGCPEPDNDGDGVPDVSDKCPNDAEDRDGFADEDGCPDLDNDGDGIADAADKCPNEPETRNGVDDEDGCPDSGGQVVIAGGHIELPDNVSFDSGRATIAARSEALLDRVADKLNAHPEVRRVRIQGHTDDLGSAQKNHDLSQARAEAVRFYLIRRGVDPERLQAVGYGNTRPLDKRRTPEARAKNRRVELIVVEE